MGFETGVTGSTIGFVQGIGGPEHILSLLQLISSGSSGCELFGLALSWGLSHSIGILCWISMAFIAKNYSQLHVMDKYGHYIFCLTLFAMGCFTVIRGMRANGIKVSHCECKGLLESSASSAGLASSMLCGLAGFSDAMTGCGCVGWALVPVLSISSIKEFLDFSIPMVISCIVGSFVVVLTWKFLLDRLKWKAEFDSKIRISLGFLTIFISISNFIFLSFRTYAVNFFKFFA